MTTDDFAGGASAPAETTTAAPEASADLRSAIDKAFETVEASEAGGERQQIEQETVVAEAPTDGSRERNPDGTFKAKEQTAEPGAEQQKPEANKPTTETTEAPAGFDPEAKAAWAATPEPVKGAVQRRFRELEAGITQYKGDATRFHSVYRPFDELAARSNIDPVQALQGYVDIDIMLAKDFGTGIDMIFKRAGADPKAWAAQIMGHPAKPGDAPPADAGKDAVIAQLQAKIGELERGVGGISKTIEQQRTDQIGGQLTNYIGSLPEADRTLFKELDGEIASILGSDPQITLTDAFAKAKGDAQAKYQRMFGTASNAAPIPTTPARAQTPTPGTGGSNPRKGQLSVTGSPGPGQSTDVRRVPSSPREALDNAFSALGL